MSCVKIGNALMIFGAGSSVDRGSAYLTLAQATLCCRHKEKAELAKEGNSSVIAVSSQATPRLFSMSMR